MLRIGLGKVLPFRLNLKYADGENAVPSSRMK